MGKYIDFDLDFDLQLNLDPCSLPGLSIGLEFLPSIGAWIRLLRACTLGSDHSLPLGLAAPTGPRLPTATCTPLTPPGLGPKLPTPPPWCHTSL